MQITQPQYCKPDSGPSRPWLVGWVLLSLLPLYFAEAAFAQDSPADADLQFRELGAAYAHMISFAAEPEISASHFSIDSDAGLDNEINALKLPLYKEFEVGGGKDWKWYAQAAVSSLRYTEEGTLSFDGFPELDTQADAEWKAYSGIVEVGLVLPLGGGFYFAPGIGAGGTRLNNESELSGSTLAPILTDILDGRFINWGTSASLGRANLGLLYREQFGTYKVRGSAHLVYSYVSSFNESREFASFDSHSGSFSVKLDVAKALGVTIGDEPLYLIGHAAGSTFIGAPRDTLGFTHFYELGVALGYRQVALGVQAVLGPDVNGVTLTLDYGF